MSNEESLETRQNNELDAIKAIYGDDITDLRPKSKKWQPLKLSVTLLPQQGNSGIQEPNAKVDLRIVCSPSYPDRPPRCYLDNARGLSSQELSQLRTELEAKTLKLKGNEMILELCQHVQEFLHKHNKPVLKSFYDEMVRRRQQEEICDKEKQRVMDDKQRQTMIIEVKKRQELYKSEKRESRRDSGSADSNLNEEPSTDPCLHDTILLKFKSQREILRGQCLEHIDDHHTIFAGIDQKSGELLRVKEWQMVCKDTQEQQLLLRHLYSIEQEMNHLMKLRHPNISQYYGFSYNAAQNMGIQIYLLEQFIFGSSCSTLFSPMNQYKLNMQLIKHLCKGVLSALEYLHRNNVFHRDVHKKHIYLTENDGVVLTSYGIYRRIVDLTSNVTSHTGYNRRADIAKFGSFLLAFIRDANQAKGQTPMPISESLHDFLGHCLCENEQNRYSASQLLNHPFLLQTEALQIIRNPKDQSFEQAAELHVPSNDILLLSSNASANNFSRIQMEFEFLQHLGKGAFGEVLKVRNRLDQQFYAIKRIKLNPKKKMWNKKVVREVKLLSRLNHENVVRYYNSWIETAVIKAGDDESDEDLLKVDKQPNKHHDNLRKVIKRLDEFTLSSDNIDDKLAPPLGNVEISVTYDSNVQQKAYQEDSSSEGSDTSEGPNWGIFNGDQPDSDFVEFIGSASKTDSVQSAETKDDTDAIAEYVDSLTETATAVKKIDFLYIQMEFCEKSTLRTAIDESLYKNMDRVWRLFREILEGLSHIHQQGMIHRDLKPANIFLDVEDHVKIGDFGLATTSYSPSKIVDFSSLRSDVEFKDIEENKTGHIGTTLYVAPEISLSNGRTMYDQKVDIYSLGIIFFEMCHRPLATTMERIQILTNLRKMEIILPNDFLFLGNQQETLIRWLLNHDASKRPTSVEILRSDHLPPPVLEERELQEMVRHTLNNPQSKSYKYLIASCFKQSLTVAQDLTYDTDPSGCLSAVSKHLHIYNHVRQVLTKVFRLHGGQNFSTPLLMPKSKYYDTVDTCVKLMTHFGGVVSLPHDLRVPFARYIAWNGITNMRRYCIDKVYREKKVFGFLPRELYECAFDIVGSNQDSLIMDAELLSVMWEIIQELPALRNRPVMVRLNHHLLIKAIFLHFGVKDKESEILCILEQKGHNDSMESRLVELGVPQNNAHSIILLLNSYIDKDEVDGKFRMITRRSGEASDMANRALTDLKTIVEHCRLLGVKAEIAIAPGMLYNIHQYSGMMFQFECEFRRKYAHNFEVFAAGGRYDGMISSYRNVMERANIVNRGLKQTAVGISISLDKIVQATQGYESADAKLYYRPLDTIIWSSNPTRHRETLQVLHSLWNRGVHSAFIEAGTIEDVQDVCMEMRVSNVCILKEGEQGMIRIRSLDRDRFNERICGTNEMLDEFQKIARSRRCGSTGATGDYIENSGYAFECTQSMGVFSYASSTTAIMSSSSPHTFTMGSSSAGNIKQFEQLNVIFHTSEKLTSNNKKRLDIQLRSQLDQLLRQIQMPATVFAVSIDISVIKSLMGFLEFANKDIFYKSVRDVIERHQRQKKYLEELCDLIYDEKHVRNKKANCVIILYSVTDYAYKVLIN